LSKLADPNHSKEKKWRSRLCVNVVNYQELIELRQQIDNALSAVGFDRDDKLF
jgi:hypothetical protein